MKLYVGILHSGENEFSDCVRSVKAQDYKDFEIFVIEGLGKKQALDTMHENFSKSGFDVLVNVGADTVLLHKRLFTNVINNIKENPVIQHYSIALHDFFSDQLIWGLNFYHDIEWEKGDEQVFTDFIPKLRTVQDLDILAPAAIHCPNPGLFQSFHYGAHKAMKILECHRRGWTEKMEYYRDIIRKTYNSFLETNDIRRSMCVVGARYAIARGLGPEQLDYTNPYLRGEFDKLFKGKENYVLF